MISNEKLLPEEELADAIERRKVAQHLQMVESNPLDAEDIALFGMFEREAWPHERRRAYLLECIHANLKAQAESIVTRFGNPFRAGGNLTHKTFIELHAPELAAKLKQGRTK